MIQKLFAALTTSENVTESLPSLQIFLYSAMLHFALLCNTIEDLLFPSTADRAKGAKPQLCLDVSSLVASSQKGFGGVVVVVKRLAESLESLPYVCFVTRLDRVFGGFFDCRRKLNQNFLPLGRSKFSAGDTLLIPGHDIVLSHRSLLSKLDSVTLAFIVHDLSCAILARAHRWMPPVEFHFALYEAELWRHASRVYFVNAYVGRQIERALQVARSSFYSVDA